MNSTHSVDGETVKLNLLLEAVESQQRTVDVSLERLHAHTRDLDALVRDEIRRTLVDTLREFANEAASAAQTLRTIRRSMSIKAAVFGATVAGLGTAVPVAVGMWILPSPADFVSLRNQQARLARNLEELRHQGGNIEWNRCGESHRLCLRIDRKAPVFGEQADFAVPKGY